MALASVSLLLDFNKVSGVLLHCPAAAAPPTYPAETIMEPEPRTINRKRPTATLFHPLKEDAKSYPAEVRLLLSIRNLVHAPPDGDAAE